MITAFRLEKDGVGPARHIECGFQIYGSNLRQWFDVLGMYRHLELVEDDSWFYRELPNIGMDSESYRFACPSMEMLIAYWTPEFFEACLLEGFEVKTYQVEGGVWMCPIGLQFMFMLEDVVHTQETKAA